MGHRHLYAATLAAVVALGLSGCTGDPEPKFADPTTDVPTSEPVEPVSDPPTSDPTTEPKTESAQAFIRRWATIETNMQNSGKTAAYRSLSDGCKGCDELATIVEGYYAAGGEVSWRGWRILSIKRFDPKRVEYRVSVDSAPTRYRTAKNAALQTLGGGKVDFIIGLHRKGASWVVVDKDRYVS